MGYKGDTVTRLAPPAPLTAGESVAVVRLSGRLLQYGRSEMIPQRVESKLPAEVVCRSLVILLGNDNIRSETALLPGGRTYAKPGRGGQDRAHAAEVRRLDRRFGAEDTAPRLSPT